VDGLVRLIVLGVITAAIGGAFVVLKNRQHALANEKGSLEGQIGSIYKQIESLDLRIAAMIGRDAIAARLAEMGNGLVKIECAEKLISGGDEGAQFASYSRLQPAREEF